MNYELSVLFTLKRSKEDKACEVPIYLRITVNGERAEVSTNRKVEIAKWDSSTHRAKGRSETARVLNDYLDNLQNRVNRDFNTLNEKGEEITASCLRDTLIGKNVKKYFLVQVFEMNNALIKLEEGQKYKRSTIDQYTTTLKRLKLFLNQEYASNDIALSNLDLLFIRRFEIYLKTNYSIVHNTVMKHLLKDSRVSEAVHFGKNAPVDGNLPKPQVKRPFGMSNSNICEFSKTMAAYELAVHDDQHMAPVGWCHSGCPVFVFYYQSFEVTFREKLHNLCENIFANVHTCSNLYLNTNEQISKGRQGFEELACCV